MDNYVLKLKFLIGYMSLLSLNHSEISEQYICGLKCALALVSETDDIETMKKKIDDIFGETETAKTRKLIYEELKKNKI